MDLFQRGTFTLHSGARSRFKIDCDALSYNDWLTIAELLADRLPPFGSVAGIPRGGETLAACLEPFVTPRYETHLIVDDVWTTGQSMRDAVDAANIDPAHREHRTIGAVAFARFLPPFWCTPLFTMGLPR